MEGVLALLRDPSRLSYLPELMKIENNQNDYFKNVTDQEMNTLELFCFGTFEDYFKYKSSYLDIPSDRELLLKLLRLTVISVSNDYEKFVLNIEQLLENKEYGLAGGLELLKLSDNSGDIENELLFEEVLISMVDDGILSAKVDDENRTIHIVKAHVLRDSYSPALHSLLVLTEQDVAKRSVAIAAETLSEWYSTKLVPLRQEYEVIEVDDITLVVPNEELDCTNTRKRKTPDQTT
ncbi:predicted protein [Scheffersomyces stipitis CBS 6054]|uniref:PCI domain-containing protein n=1 Tax=Scheffersomyces stipitis (strain ATCC 58785 / CBS 6054 / NBRC 10063 / NRRL Y-11545) TaxID=322104 RepID=A3LXI2_PICST|nr:predicted protein [Scheffersomyces stipitis CBS 6054]ABN67463.2 predicted protein [Scheffersomyces stipitis CBS 6054]KAG2732270.1 hypothetical protein G9P44_004687 [Scheffersomyces stipitis]